MSRTRRGRLRTDSFSSSGEQIPSSTVRRARASNEGGAQVMWTATGWTDAV
ncbi:hypothetical protein [Streptomyces sp. NPDC060198]|uniref:hypothetical protein n=1 Tax=Streptomyces sp. NPDC060198 TaxID=3347070 RepID=UPI0036492F48